MIDSSQIDTAPHSPSSECSSANDEGLDGFSRFRKIPIGTFWQSQRLNRNLQRNKHLQKAVKRSPAGSPMSLNATLFPRPDKRNALISPQLVPIQETPIKSVCLLEDFQDLDIPPPLTPL